MSPAPADVEYTLPIQRVQGLIEVATSKGWDITAALADAGVAPELLAQGGSRVTLEQAVRLVQWLWRETGDELLGLGLQPVPLGTFRLVCFGLLGAPTARAAAQRYANFQRSLPGVPPVSVRDVGEEVRLSFDISDVVAPVALPIDTMLAACHRFACWAAAKWLPLRRVEVPYSAIPGLDDYDQMFGAPVVFEAPAPALIFTATVFDAPLVRDEKDLMLFLSNAPAGVMGRREFALSVAGRVRTILERGLDGTWPSVEDIAAELAMSPQTLRRKLGDEGVSLRRIREQILRDAAIAGLVRGEETVAALARRLGFSEASAFSRAFRRWTGSAPGSYQR
ncbi:AraC family transcriptional regulator [Nocardia sp. NPDC050712]|uniref:AraC family transcriptional regulator n=1 Tax=Nocardia sp. NPDC050712 TaxID=3155518 RepID=UPI0033D463B4